MAIDARVNGNDGEILEIKYDGWSGRVEYPYLRFLVKLTHGTIQGAKEFNLSKVNVVETVAALNNMCRHAVSECSIKDLDSGSAIYVEALYRRSMVSLKGYLEDGETSLKFFLKVPDSILYTLRDSLSSFAEEAGVITRDTRGQIEI